MQTIGKLRSLFTTFEIIYVMEAYSKFFISLFSKHYGISNPHHHRYASKNASQVSGSKAVYDAQSGKF